MLEEAEEEVKQEANVDPHLALRGLCQEQQQLCSAVKEPMLAAIRQNEEF